MALIVRQMPDKPIRIAFCEPADPSSARTQEYSFLRSLIERANAAKAKRNGGRMNTEGNRPA